MTKRKTKMGIIDPTGKIRFVYHWKRRQFAEKHGLKLRAVTGLLSGELATVRGWISVKHKRKAELLRKQRLYLINVKTNEIIKKPLKENHLCKVIGVNRDCLNKLIRNMTPSAKGWMTLDNYELIYGKINKDRLR